MKPVCLQNLGASAFGPRNFFKVVEPVETRFSILLHEVADTLVTPPISRPLKSYGIGSPNAAPSTLAVFFALCDERAVRLMKDHIADDGTLSAESTNAALQFECSRPSDPAEDKRR